MLADDQRKNSGVGATVMLPLSGIDMIELRDRNVCSSSSCSRAVEISVPGSGCFCFALRHASIGSLPFKRPASWRNSSCVAASSRVAIASRRSTGSVMPSSSRSFCSKRSRPRRNVPFAFGRMSFSRSST